MNRVVLCGTLVERPCFSTTPTGLSVAALRLRVPRQGLSEPPNAIDEIDCLAFDELARALHRCGEPGLRVNLEGWLLSGYLSNEDRPRLVYRVAVEAAYWLDPREHAPVRVPTTVPSDSLAEQTAMEGHPSRAHTFCRFSTRVRHFWSWLRFPSGSGRPAWNGQNGR